MSSLLLLGTGGGGGAPFDPVNLPGLEWLYEADMTGADLVLSGSDVTTWGLASLIQFTEALGSKRPEFVADDGDGKEAVRFDGIDDSLRKTSLTVSSSFTSMHVSRNSKTNAQITEHGDADPGFYNGFVSTVAASFFRVDRGANQSTFSISIDGTDDVWRLWVQEHNGTHASHQAYIDGVIQTRIPSTSDDIGISDITRTMSLGAENGTARFQQGAQRFGLLCSPMLSAQDRIDASNYALAKWVT